MWKRWGKLFHWVLLENPSSLFLCTLPWYPSYTLLTMLTPCPFDTLFIGNLLTSPNIHFSCSLFATWLYLFKFQYNNLDKTKCSFWEASVKWIRSKTCSKITPTNNNKNSNKNKFWRSKCSFWYLKFCSYTVCGNAQPQEKRLRIYLCILCVFDIFIYLYKFRSKKMRK